MHPRNPQSCASPCTGQTHQPELQEGMGQKTLLSSFSLIQSSLPTSHVHLRLQSAPTSDDHQPWKANLDWGLSSWPTFLTNQPQYCVPEARCDLSVFMDFHVSLCSWPPWLLQHLPAEHGSKFLFQLWCLSCPSIVTQRQSPADFSLVVSTVCCHHLTPQHRHLT